MDEADSFDYALNSMQLVCQALGDKFLEHSPAQSLSTIFDHLIVTVIGGCRASPMVTVFMGSDAANGATGSFSPSTASSACKCR
jgi:hypothetical protein